MIDIWTVALVLTAAIGLFFAERDQEANVIGIIRQRAGEEVTSHQVKKELMRNRSYRISNGLFVFFVASVILAAWAESEKAESALTTAVTFIGISLLALVILRTAAYLEVAGLRRLRRTSRED